MSLECVHENQKVYRSLLNAISRPGKIEVLEKCDSCINSLSKVLLDSEVSFTVISKNEELIKKEIIELSLAIYSDIENADYIFVDKDVDGEGFVQIIKLCKEGDLINPQKSATILKKINSLTSGKKVYINGPGVNGSKKISLDLLPEVLKARELKNKEFPMGIDIILFDDDFNIMGIPRTTIIREDL